MSDKGKIRKTEFDQEQAKKWLEIGIDFAGENWLEQKGDEIDSDIIEYYKAGLKEYGEEEREVPELIPEDYKSTSGLKFVNLGRLVTELEDACVIDQGGEEISNDIKDEFQERLRRPEEFESALFEMQVGAQYTSYNHTVEFIQVGGSASKESTDIRITHKSGNIYVECKRCDDLTGDAQKRRSNLNHLMEKVESLIQLDEYIAYLNLREEPKRSDIDRLNQDIPNNLGHEEIIEIPSGKLHILSYNKDGEVMSFPTMSVDVIERQKRFYEYHVKPEIFSKIGVKPEWFDTNGRMEAEISSDETNSGITYWRNSKWIGVNLKAEDDHETQILNQIDNARKKFEKGNPNILHIDTPFIDDLMDEEIDRIGAKIGNKLNVNSRITAIVMSVERSSTEDEVRSQHIFEPIMNYTPATHFPAGFKLLGMDPEELRRDQRSLE